MASETGGVKAFSIQGRLYRERERLLGMTSQERAWRKQWIKDQNLSHSEPRHVPEIYKELYNPIRRAYWYPMDRLFKLLEPVLGKTGAISARVMTSRIAMMVVAGYGIAYYFKYNANDWTRKGGWRAVPGRQACVPGEMGFPKISDRSVGADYATRGFKNAPI